MIGLDNPIHLLFLLVIVLLLFGARRLPELGRSLGSGMRGFREALQGEVHAESTQPEVPSVPPSTNGAAAQPEGAVHS